jgi:hypothetical protein
MCEYRTSLFSLKTLMAGQDDTMHMSLATLNSYLSYCSSTMRQIVCIFQHTMYPPAKKGHVSVHILLKLEVNNKLHTFSHAPNKAPSVHTYSLKMYTHESHDASYKKLQVLVHIRQTGQSFNPSSCAHTHDTRTLTNFHARLACDAKNARTGIGIPVARQTRALWRKSAGL